VNPAPDVAQGSFAVRLARAAQGDLAARDAVAGDAYRIALRSALGICGDRELAGDVAQDATIEVLRALTQLREPAAFHGWVHRITVRKALRVIKTRRRRQAYERELDAEDVATISSARVSEPASADHLAVADAIRRALATLPDRQRVAVTLRYVHDLTEREIAAAMRARPGTVASLLSRGREALRTDPNLEAVLS
jgi:RNA polymerase sigma factor (sigma-70 family)